MSKRTVDLGREDHPVTWAEWFSRAGQRMATEVPKELHQHLAYRVTLRDKRQFAVMHMFSFVSRGKCELAPNRWKTGETDVICDVITGYMLLAIDHHSNPTAVCVTPEQIVSIECVLLVPEAEEQQTPFGFAAYAHRKSAEKALEEIDEPLPVASSANEEQTG